MLPKIYFFRESPIDVDIKMYNSFFDMWNSDFIVFVEKEFDDCRNCCGFDNEQTKFKHRKIGSISNSELESIFSSDNILLFNGMSIAKKYYYLISKYNRDIGIVSERDSFLYNSKFEIIVKKFFPKIQLFRNKDIYKHIKAFLAMGEQGVQCYKKYGISSKYLFDFMYCDGNAHQEPKPVDGKLKFLYVGRFDYKVKGVDILLNAARIAKSDFSIDIFGGYGNDKEEVIKLISKNHKLKYCGVIKQSNLINVLNNYDCIIVPSRNDGWNLHNNLAINSGICSITSNQAGSHELIKNCGNGVVIKSITALKLANQIDYFCTNKKSVDEMKKMTISYSKLISPDSIAKYLHDILFFCFVNNENIQKPFAPWLSLEGK